ncbi:MAG: helix-turn-helix domain-containing protein [Panacagrimonas sp.]
MRTDNALRSILKDPRKRRSWVLYQLQLEGRNLSDLAAENGVTRQCIYHAFRVPYPRMEMLVATAVGLTPQQLFSERYDADGLPIRRKGRPPIKVSCHGGKDKPRRQASDIQAKAAA